MDFIRELLLMVESGQLPADPDAAPVNDCEIEITREKAQKLTAYLDLLKRNALIKVEFEPGSGVYNIGGLTEKGLDFLNEIR